MLCLDFCFGLIPSRDYHHVKYLEVIKIYRLGRPIAAIGSLDTAPAVKRPRLAVRWDCVVERIGGSWLLTQRLQICQGSQKSLKSYLYLHITSYILICYCCSWRLGKQDNTKGSLVEQIKVLNLAK